MTARSSWNQRNTCGRRPRLQRICRIQDIFPRAPLRLAPQTVGAVGEAQARQRAASSGEAQARQRAASSNDRPGFLVQSPLRERPALFTDDLDQHPLFPPAVKLSVEDLFPGSKVEPTVRNSNDHLASHDLPLDMRIGIVLSSVVVSILAHRLM